MTATSDPPRREVSGPEPAGSDSRSLSASVRRGALWVVASNLLLRVANLALTAIVARILSPHDFGVFAVALTAYVIVSSIGELGVASCLFRADLDIDRLAPTVASIALVSSAILAFAMAAFAGPIATALGSAAAAGPIRVMSLAVLLIGVLAVPNAQMVRDFKQDKIFLANAIAFVPSTVLLIFLAKNGSGAMAFAWSRVATQADGLRADRGSAAALPARPHPQRPIRGLQVRATASRCQSCQLHSPERRLCIRRPHTWRCRTWCVHAGLHPGIRTVQPSGRSNQQRVDARILAR